MRRWPRLSWACPRYPAGHIRKVASDERVTGTNRVHRRDADSFLAERLTVDQSKGAIRAELDDGLARPRSAIRRARSSGSPVPTAMAASSSPANAMSASG